MEETRLLYIRVVMQPVDSVTTAFSLWRAVDAVGDAEEADLDKAERSFSRRKCLNRPLFNRFKALSKQGRDVRSCGCSFCLPGDMQLQSFCRQIESARSLVAFLFYCSLLNSARTQREGDKKNCGKFRLRPWNDTFQLCVGLKCWQQSNEAAAFKALKQEGCIHAFAISDLVRHGHERIRQRARLCAASVPIHAFDADRWKTEESR